VIDGKLSPIEYYWLANERPNEGAERFEMVSTLSRMFSRYYTQQTNGRPTPRRSNSNTGRTGSPARYLLTIRVTHCRSIQQLEPG
jgi:hypothetical protein